jgi:hypothetical protein
VDFDGGVEQVLPLVAFRHSAELNTASSLARPVDAGTDRCHCRGWFILRS